MKECKQCDWVREYYCNDNKLEYCELIEQLHDEAIDINTIHKCNKDNMLRMLNLNESSGKVC